MSTISFDQALRAARQLTPVEQDELMAHLRGRNEPAPSEHDEQLRAHILAEFERRKATGAFENAAILRNKYANPALEAMSDEQLLADLHNIASEWEKELDELDTNDN
jgi:hypothetical protein